MVTIKTLLSFLLATWASIIVITKPFWKGKFKAKMIIYLWSMKYFNFYLYYIKNFV